MNGPIITNPMHLMMMRDNKIRWEYKSSTLHYDEVHGFIDEDIEYYIKININKSYCYINFILLYSNIDKGWLELKRFNSLKKAKKYAQKHYLKNTNG